MKLNPLGTPFAVTAVNSVVAQAEAAGSACAYQNVMQQTTYNPQPA